MDLHKYELNRPIVEILIAAVVLLALGQAYIMYSMSNRAQTRAPGFTSAGAVGNIDGISAADISPAPSTVLVPMAGEVSGVEENAVVVTGIGGQGAARRIVVNNDTEITLRGSMKDEVTIGREISAFREKSRVLEQDVKANDHALRRLVSPSPFVQESISLEDVRVGDYVGAFLDDGVALRMEVLRNR